MCGRYALKDTNELSKFYEVELPTETKPNYNLTPEEISVIEQTTKD